MKSAGDTSELLPATDGGGVRIRTAPIPTDRTVEAKRPWWRDALRRRLLAAADLIGAASATITLTAPNFQEAGLWPLLFLPIWIAVAKLVGLYDRDQRSIRHLTIDELPGLAAWAGASLAIVGGLLELTPGGSVTLAMALPAWLVGTVAAALARGASRLLWRRLTRPERVLIATDDRLQEVERAPYGVDSALAIRRKIELFNDMHMEVCGTIPLHRLGSFPGGIDRIIVASEGMDPSSIAPLLEACRRRQVKLSVISPLRGPAGPVLRLSKVAGLPVFEYGTWDVSETTRIMKRALDLAVSAVALLLLLPLLPILALAIRLDSSGPVIFTQMRAGAGGRPFRVFKLRTMTRDAPERLGGLIDLDALAEPAFKFRRDPRVTRVGRFLRRFSIDEIPQLYNVLRGDMSLVGPRPEQVEVVARYRPGDRFRLAVKPGITGPMQVYGRGELGFDERLALERDYIANVSINGDIRILLMTISAVLHGTGAY